jgi:hypothetical protein
VLSRDGDVMQIEVPADMLGAATGLLGQGGFVFNIGNQRTDMAPRRITNMEGRTVVCDETALMAFYEIEVKLAPRTIAVSENPHAGAIWATRPTPKFRG